MAGVGGAIYTDFPGQMSYDDDHSLQLGASATVTSNVDTNSTLRVAWAIIIGSLVLLWFLGYTFRG